ncbi:hypothetical protein RF11_00265 [Thelohanellus kitauei]|uniref:Uncharacterized protein n=1 Tax=Thelohanellus kitauei TaxID=669202 RepID=A0A0C2NEA6_THEKT|nr:hypothetical protein RF11_00265 [Thelohanellus kitauei]
MDIDFDPYRSIIMKITDIMVDSKKSGSDFKDRKKLPYAIFFYERNSECYLRLFLKCFDNEDYFPIICLFDTTKISNFSINHVCTNPETFEVIFTFQKKNALMFPYRKQTSVSNFTTYLTDRVDLDFRNPFELKTASSYYYNGYNLQNVDTKRDQVYSVYKGNFGSI